MANRLTALAPLFRVGDWACSPPRVLVEADACPGWCIDASHRCLARGFGATAMKYLQAAHPHRLAQDPTQA